MIRSERTGSALRPPRSCPHRTWWLLAKNESGRTEVFTVNGELTLPAFSGKGEAEMFVWLGGTFDDGWRIRETSTGELLSILCGPCASVKSIALDPSPGMVTSGTIALVTVARERFLDQLAAPSSSLPVAAAK